MIEKGLQDFKKILKRNSQEILFFNDFYDEERKLAYIRRLSLTPSGILYDIKEPEMTNKVLRIFHEVKESIYKFRKKIFSLEFILKMKTYKC